jgi:hypothetical protein
VEHEFLAAEGLDGEQGFVMLPVVVAAEQQQVVGSRAP